jgi:hypothetical protein
MATILKDALSGHPLAQADGEAIPSSVLAPVPTAANDAASKPTEKPKKERKSVPAGEPKKVAKAKKSAETKAKSPAKKATKSPPSVEKVEEVAKPKPPAKAKRSRVEIGSGDYVRTETVRHIGIVRLSLLGQYSPYLTRVSRQGSFIGVVRGFSQGFVLQRVFGSNLQQFLDKGYRSITVDAYLEIEHFSCGFQRVVIRANALERKQDVHQRLLVTHPAPKMETPGRVFAMNIPHTDGIIELVKHEE